MPPVHRLARSQQRTASPSLVRFTKACRQNWRIVVPSLMPIAVAVAVVLLAAGPGAGQLPPEVLADSHLLQVEQALRDGHPSQAWARMQDVVRLQREHDLDLPEFDFWYAKAADAMDLPQQALESVSEYLASWGREAQHYAEALALMNSLQTAVRCEGWNSDAYFETATPEQTTACLETGDVDLDARNASGFTPLHAAATHSGEPAVIQALLDAGAHVEATDATAGATPLSLAVRHNGAPAVIEVLLDAGASLETSDASGRTPLHLAAAHIDDPEVFEVLLIAGSDLTIPNQVFESAERSIEILLEAGAEPTALEQALESLTENLVFAGSDVSNDARAQALMETVRTARRCQGWNTGGYFEAATLDQVTTCLGTDTINLGERNAKGLTPLHAAAASAQEPAVIRALLAAGADPTRTHRWEETGQLAAGDTAGSDGSYQDTYSVSGGGNQTVTVDLRSDDFDTFLMVESPSGAHQANDDYQGDKERSRLTLILDEVGEYQVIVSSFSAGESGAYSLHVEDEPPAYLAARYNENPGVVEVFLNAGFNPKQKKEDGSTLLNAAAEKNRNPSVIESLIAAGADLEAADEDDWTPLHHAAINPNPAVIEALLDVSGNMEQQLKKRTAGNWTILHLAAAQNENPAVVEILLRAGADLKATDSTFGSGFRGHIPRHWTPLHFAAMNNANPDVIKVLLDAGADPNRNSASGTPLHLAAGGTHNPVVIDVLLNAGAELEKRGGLSGQRPVHLAAVNENMAVIETFLNAGADLNVTDKNKSTTLHYAARSNENPAVIKFLVDAGVALEALDDDKRTPLHVAAAFNENRAVIQTLLDAGAALNVTDKNKWTALHHAASSNKNPAVTNLLLNAGVDAEALDEDRRTPLHVAAEFNENPAIVHALVNGGADVEAQDEDGHTPLHYATNDNGNSAVRQVLLQSGAGQTERARASQQGDGFGRGIAALIGGAAIAVAGGGTEEAMVAGAGFAESVITGQPVGNSGGGGSPDVFGSAGNTGVTAGGGSCLIPGYPTPANPQTLGLASCPAFVNFQTRVFALQAAGAQCAIATGSSSTPEQINARRQEIQAACGRLAAMGVSNCQCPLEFGGPGYSEDSSSIEREQEEARQAAERERQARQEEEARQAAQREKRRIEANNATVLSSNCNCISIEENGEYSCLDGFVVGNNSSGQPLCDISR